MRKILLLITAALLFNVMGFAQSGNPIGTASISPNPVESKAALTFEEPVLEDINVVVKDLTGKVLYNFKPDTHGEECTSVRMDMLENLRRGIYIIQVTGTSGKVKTLKFQKT